MGHRFWCSPCTMKYGGRVATLQQRLQDFDQRTRRLFEGRPYWLVEEALVRAAFVDALLSQQTFDAKIHNARHICLEAERCEEKKRLS